MKVKILKNKIKQEQLLKLEELSAENLYACYQCGNCSASCPAADFMELLPHQVIRYAQIGLIDEIVKTNTMWICAACVNCAVKCPKNVDLSKIMESLRHFILRDKKNYVDARKIAQKVLEDLPQIALVGNFRKFTL